jgi:hypothetical protein
MKAAIKSEKNLNIHKHILEAQFINKFAKTEIQESIDMVLVEIIDTILDSKDWKQTAENIEEVNVVIYKKVKIQIERLLESRIREKPPTFEERPQIELKDEAVLRDTLKSV